MTDTQQIALALSEVISEGDWRLLFLERDEIKTSRPGRAARRQGLSQGIQTARLASSP